MLFIVPLYLVVLPITVTLQYTLSLASDNYHALASLASHNFCVRGTMFRWTLKVKEVLNKQILSASVPETAVLI